MIVKENDQVVIKKDTHLRVVQARPDRLISMERSKFTMNSVIGEPYGSTFEVQNRELVKVTREVISTEVETGRTAAEKDNRHLVDKCGNQKLTRAEIEVMKKDGCRGESIIDQLIENSATFHQKTDFSQQKYIKKKKKKYVPVFTILKPTTRLLAEMYYSRGPLKICNLRIDTLSQILCHANVRAHSRMLLVETCAGLVLGGVMERMAGFGVVVNFYSGSAPTRPALEGYNLPASHRQTLYDFPLDLIHSLRDAEDSAAELGSGEVGVGGMANTTRETPAMEGTATTCTDVMLPPIEGTATTCTSVVSPAMEGTETTCTGVVSPTMEGTATTCTGVVSPPMEGTATTCTDVVSPPIEGTATTCTGVVSPPIEGTATTCTGMVSPAMEGTATTCTGVVSPAMEDTATTCTDEMSPPIESTATTCTGVVSPPTCTDKTSDTTEDCKNTLVTTTDHEMAEDSLGRGAEMDQSQPDDRHTEDSGLPDSKEHEKFEVRNGSINDDDSTRVKAEDDVATGRGQKRKRVSEEERDRRRLTKSKMQRDVRALMKEGKMDGLIVACKFHPTPIVLSLIDYVAPSRQIIVYCQYREPLLDCYMKLKSRGGVLLLRLTETWLREYQVLPNRTHPAINMSASSGYLLVATTVKL